METVIMDVINLKAKAAKIENTIGLE